MKNYSIYSDIPKLELSRELTSVSHSDISKMKPVSTVRKSHGHHRNMNALKDPEELERIEKAKNKRIQVEKGKKRHKHFNNQ